MVSSVHVGVSIFQTLHADALPSAMVGMNSPLREVQNTLCSIVRLTNKRQCTYMLLAECNVSYPAVFFLHKHHHIIPDFSLSLHKVRGLCLGAQCLHYSPSNQVYL